MSQLGCFLIAAGLAATAVAAESDSFLIRHATIHSMAGPEITDGSVLVRDGKIAGVGQALQAPAGVRVIEGKGLHVYPGLIDSGTEVGLSEIGAVRESNDVRELGRFNPELRASIAVNPSSEHIPVTRANGVTSVLALPEGELIGGQASLLHLDGWTTDQMTFKTGAALVLRMPVIETRTFSFPAGTTTTPFEEARKNYERQIRELDQFFEAARRYQKARQANLPGFQTDLKLEAMLPVLDGSLPVLVLAPTERAIRDALALADRQKIKLILGDADQAYKVTKEIAERHIPVILGPTLSLPRDEDDPYDRQFTTPADLYKSGIPFAFASYSVEFSRNLPYQAAAAVAFGLPHDEALKAMTINAARIWGVDKQTGSIEEGKWADLMLTDGDPLEETTEVKQLFIKGQAVSLDNKQHRLFEKYSSRP